MTAPGTWTCPGEPYTPGCPGGEQYLLFDDPEWRSRFAECMRLCQSEFGLRLKPEVETVLLMGVEPESVFERHAGYHSIYFRRGSDLCQLSYQLGQEVFHRVCTPSGTNHWVHEMFSLLWALDYLEKAGMRDCARRQMKGLTRESRHLSVDEMMAVNKMPYPNGMYGRAFVAGDTLRRQVGWPALKPLARIFDPRGKPDPASWKRSLTQEMQAAIAWLPI
jgi:hypothetical protein